jgi:hypothetical protein
MKNILLFAIFGLCFLFTAGCQEAARKEKPVKTAIGSSGDFPGVMVGVWEAEQDDTKLGIKFEPDGSIRKVVHYLAGPVNLAEGGVSMDGPEPNTYAMFIMGPCTAEYDKASGVLKVKMVLDYYEMQLPNGKLWGRTEDYFEGTISEDGTKWYADWRSYGYLEGATPPDVNYINANPEKLVFSKIDGK